MLDPKPPHCCQSCHARLEEDEAFCVVCGQKRLDKPMTLRELLGDVLSNIFALDSKLLRTFFQLLFRPGALSLAYWKGVRQRYYTPFKLFLFCLTVFVLLFSWQTAQVREHSSAANDNIVIWKYQQQLKGDLLGAGLDSLAVDSLLYQSKKQLRVKDGIINLDLDNVALEDLHSLPLDSLAQNFSEGSFIQDLFNRQLFKSQRRPGDFELLLLGNLSWIIFLSIPLAALWLLLLFPKKQPYYTAHLTFTLLLETVGLLLAIFLLVLKLLFPQSITHPNSTIGATITLVLYTGLALKHCHQQSLVVTGLKLFLLLLGLLLILVVALFGF